MFIDQGFMVEIISKHSPPLVRRPIWLTVRDCQDGGIFCRLAGRVALLTEGRLWMIMAYVRDAASCPGLRVVRCP